MNTLIVLIVDMLPNLSYHKATLLTVPLPLKLFVNFPVAYILHILFANWLFSGVRVSYLHSNKERPVNIFLIIFFFTIFRREG